MIVIEYNGVSHTFHSFEELAHFIRDEVHAIEDQNKIAVQALKYLKTSPISGDMMKYYMNVFNAYLNKHMKPSF